MNPMLVDIQCHLSGRCKTHSKPLIGRYRPRYIGPHIPLFISKPIRAALLHGVSHTDIQTLVIDLMSISPNIMNGNPPVLNSLRWISTLYIGIVSGFTVPELVDNCFWGDGSATRKDGVSVKRNRPKHPIPNCMCVFLAI